MEHVVINSLFVVALGIIGMHTHMFANKNREKERKKAPNSCTLAAARTYIGHGRKPDVNPDAYVAPTMIKMQARV